MSVPFGQGELGEIVAGRTRYRIIWDDLLWSARMLVGEAGGNAGTTEGAAVLWTMASLFTIRRKSSYKQLIQEYSQPINPKWMADGDFCRPGGVHPNFANNPRENGERNYHGDDRFCSLAQLERRANTQNKTWEEIPSDVQDLVYKWATGQVNNPVPKAVEFAQPAIASKSNGIEGLLRRGFELVWDTLNRGPTSIERRGNAFYSNERSRNWNENHVKIIRGTNEASDSNLDDVGRETRPFGQSGERSESAQSNNNTLTPPRNDIFERTSTITSDRTTAPTVGYSYFQVDGNFTDDNAAEKLSQQQTERVARNSADRFLQQINSLRVQNNVKMSQVLPIIQILTEGDPEDNEKIINLNEKIFSVSPHDRRYSEEFEIFPDRPLASLESFEVSVQESRSGPVGICLATLNLKVHNPEMVRRSHPIGKYIAYMMSQGFTMRIRYGMSGFEDSTSINDLHAFQWKEEDFFVTEYRININNDNTMNLSVKLMPKTHRLLNQIRIGQSIPVSSLGTLRTQDIRDIIDQVSSDNPNTTREQVYELKQRLTRFNTQLNSQLESPGAGLEERVSGTFSFQLHAALNNSEIFSRNDAVQPVPIPNMVEALQGVQSVLLTRRFERILQMNCYRTTIGDTSFNAANLGPVIHEIVKPEIDYIFGTLANDQIEIGEKFSVEDRPIAGSTRPQRTNVKLVFGNFNERAGQWANKPISIFPINVESIFSEIRKKRDVGQFASTVNNFFQILRRLVQQRVNYVSTNEDDLRHRIETPGIRYVIYPDVDDETSWIMYVYDEKVPVVKLRNVLDALSNTNPGRIPSREETKLALRENGIPWLEKNEEGSFVSSFTAETMSDDLLATSNYISAGREQRTVRDLDASSAVPAGISREFIEGSQGSSQSTIRQNSRVMPVKVSVQTKILPTAYFMAPIVIFFPVRTFSGVYLISQISHEIKSSGAITNMNLIINNSVYNNIPL